MTSTPTVHPLERWLTAHQAAPLLGVSAKTLARWAKQGLVPCLRTLGGHRRYRQADIHALRDTLRHRSGQWPQVRP